MLSCARKTRHGLTGLPSRALALASALPFIALVASASAAGAAPSPPLYTLTAQIGLGPGKRWDYITVDSAAHRLYLARADRVEVIDTQTQARIGTITGLQGTHGIAIAEPLGRGFISDGKGNKVVVFDLKSLAVIQTVPVGRNPDAIVFDPLTRRVVALNGASHDASILDAASGAVIALSVPLGGKPEFSHVNAAGHAFMNIEDTAEIVDLDLANAAVSRRYSIAPCEEPTGLAIGPADQLVSVCANGIAVVSDPASGRVVNQLAIGAGPDGVAFDDGYAYSANGRDGTISVLPLGAGASGVGTIASRPSARTIDVDPATHKLYLPSRSAAAGETTQADQKAAPQSDDIEILVFSRK